VTLDRAEEIAGPVILVTGTFDILRAEHAREITAVRSSAPEAALLVAVLPSRLELLSQRARAEMVAALRMVDYVLTAAYGDLDVLIGSLRPVRVVRLEEADARRLRQLTEHVHRRQKS
jgi:glycerol-3-phosphate cytidylyltransferase-like family protein